MFSLKYENAEIEPNDIEILPDNDESEIQKIPECRREKKI